MHLIWVKTASGGVAAQKWRESPTVKSDPYFKGVIVQAIALPPEDHDLSIDSLVAKYGTPI